MIHKLSLCIALVSATAALPLLSTAGDVQHGTPASADTTGRVEHHRAFDFDAEVGAVLEVSLLPVTQGSAGESVRAISAVLMYQKRTAYLGTSNYHQLVPTDSNRTIDMSLDKLDLSTDAVSPDAPAEYRSYRATLAPKSGLTWGTVRDFKQDVELEYAPR